MLKTRKRFERYRVEPYVLAGDVYSRTPHAGRGGWTWYTGSASWYYQAILESILGFHHRGDRLSLSTVYSAGVVPFRDHVSFPLERPMRSRWKTQREPSQASRLSGSMTSFKQGIAFPWPTTTRHIRFVLSSGSHDRKQSAYVFAGPAFSRVRCRCDLGSPSNRTDERDGSSTELNAALGRSRSPGNASVSQENDPGRCKAERKKDRMVSAWSAVLSSGGGSRETTLPASNRVSLLSTTCAGRR